MKSVLKRLWRIPLARIVQLSAVLTILALSLMVWSMLRPTWLPVILAMSVGQLFGTLAFALYGIAIWRERRQARRARHAAISTKAET